LIVLLAVAVLAVVGTGVALTLAPAALLALSLLFGRCPGERAIRRLACRVAVAQTPRPVMPPRRLRSLGASLAVPRSGRAPPAALLI